MLYTMDQEIIYILPFGITSYTVCISVTGIFVRVHVLMFFRCRYLLFICDCCFYLAIVFSSLNRVFCETYNSAFGRDSCGGLALTPSIFTFAIVYSFS